MNKTIKVILWIIVLGVVVFSLIKLLEPTHGDSSKNTDVESRLSNLRGLAETIYESSPLHSYTTVCQNTSDNTAIQNTLKELNDVTGENPKCFSDEDSWVAAAKLFNHEESITHYCVDSTGAFKAINDQQYSTITSANTLCP